MDNPGTDSPWTDGLEGDVPQATRKDGPKRPQRGPYALRWPIGLGFTAVLIIGTSLLYWYGVPDRGFAKTEAVRISGNPAHGSPYSSSSTVRVMVDARLGTVLIEFRPESGQTPGTSSLPANAQSGAVLSR